MLFLNNFILINYKYKMTIRLYNTIESSKLELKKKNFILNAVLLNILFINFINSISGNEIRLVIKGGMNQNITSNDYGGTLPSIVIVNGVTRTGCTKQCDLYNDKNNVTLKFTTLVNSCRFMFNHVYSIIEVDLSYFDASQLNTMFCMFQACISLEKVNFGNIDTSSVEDMYGLLTDCVKLTSVNISHIDTSKVSDMGGMFNNCPNLIYLNLSNFDVGKVTSMKNMFSYSSSLIYLDLYSFKITDSINIEQILTQASLNTKYCINDATTKQILYNTNGIVSNCSDICFKDNIKIDITNKICVKSCQNINYEKDNFCLNECKIGNYPLSCFLNECDQYPINCYNQTPESYYLDLNNKLYKKCYENCKSCYGEGTETYNNCKECNNNYYFLNESLYETNCYEKCGYYYYFDEWNKYHCTLNLSCPVNYKLIASKKKCIDECKNKMITLINMNIMLFVILIAQKKL